MEQARVEVDQRWLTACRRISEAAARVFEEFADPLQREQIVGRGEGGDSTLVIDQRVEDAVFVELESLHRDGLRFTAVAEERGEVEFGDRSIRVVIDPIDGSLNAKRGLSNHSLSIAVADGELMSDVFFGYVFDHGPAEEWVAYRGGGSFLNRQPLAVREPRLVDGRLELVGIESADPLWIADSVEQLGACAYRLRATGSIAITMCQVAAGRIEGMLSLRTCRSVDAAASQLIVREAGGEVLFSACDSPLAFPLDLKPHSPVVAGVNGEVVERLAGCLVS